MYSLTWHGQSIIIFVVHFTDTLDKNQNRTLQLSFSFATEKYEDDLIETIPDNAPGHSEIDRARR